MEHWHPNPEFFFKRGGGPILDIGPYYVTQLVNLLGPVDSGSARRPRPRAPTRTVTSEPRRGQVIEVEVPTTVNGVLSFASGANVALTRLLGHLEAPAPADRALRHRRHAAGARPELLRRRAAWSASAIGDWHDLDITAHPFGVPNRTLRSGAEVADYRIIGVLDMAAALHQGRPHRANGDLALHVLEVLDAFERSSVEGPPRDDRDPLRASGAGAARRRRRGVYAIVNAIETGRPSWHQLDCRRRAYGKPPRRLADRAAALAGMLTSANLNRYGRITGANSA